MIDSSDAPAIALLVWVLACWGLYFLLTGVGARRSRRAELDYAAYRAIERVADNERQMRINCGFEPSAIRSRLIGDRVPSGTQQAFLRAQLRHRLPFEARGAVPRALLRASRGLAVHYWEYW